MHLADLLKKRIVLYFNTFMVERMRKPVFDIVLGIRAKFGPRHLSLVSGGTGVVAGEEVVRKKDDDER